MTTPGHDLDRYRRLRVIPRTRDPRIRSNARDAHGNPDLLADLALRRWMKPSTGGSSVPGGVWLASMVEVSSPRAATRAMSCSAMPASGQWPDLQPPFAPAAC